MDRTGLIGVLDALRAADEDIASVCHDAAYESDDGNVREALLRIEQEHRAVAAEATEQARRLGRGTPARTDRAGRHVQWGTSGYGTGDQFGGGQAEGAGGYPSAGPSYSGGAQDVNTGE